MAEERRPAAVVFDGLDRLGTLARELGAQGRTDVAEFDSRLSSDDV